MIVCHCGWKTRCSMRGIRETSPLNAELFVMIMRWLNGGEAHNISLEMVDLDSKDMRNFIEGMPKVELHAHLSGSISMPTIQRLLELRKKRGDITSVDPGDVRIDTKQIRTLDDCFAIFKLVQKLCDTEEAIYMVTREVIHEFAADNVKYLELRSTPRAVSSNGMTTTSYVDAILRAIGECHLEQDLDITVRLLLSIDRRCPVSEAVDTVKLAAEYMNKTGGIVTGIDLSGDPTKGDVDLLLPALSSAKEKGLKLTLHMAEVPGQSEECTKLLALSPDRIGHGTYLHLAGDDHNGLVERITACRIPLELCVTSNVKDQTVPCLQDHHFGFWYERGHPCVICTDDKGVFATSLSEEYSLVADTFHLSPQQIWTLSFSTIDYIFADDHIKERLRKKWVDLKSTLPKGDSELV